MKQPLPQDPFYLSDVGFVDTDLTDEEVALLGGCRGILKLDARNNSKLTAAGLKNVGSLPRLETLSLDETACAREDLEFVSNYPRLRTLSIIGLGTAGTHECRRLAASHTIYQSGTTDNLGFNRGRCRIA
jgi:hypothetical protein